MTKVWKSEDTKKDHSSLINAFELRKWSFLLVKPELTKRILDGIKEKSTEISHVINKEGIKVKFRCKTRFKNRIQFKQWKSECFESAEEILSDLLFVFIGCELKETEVIRNALSRKTLSTVKVLKQNYTSGICLLGNGESLINVILEICKSGLLKDHVFFDEESKQEIEIVSIKLDVLQTRCLNHLDLGKRVNQKFPLVKTYIDSDGKTLKLIGNKEDVRQEEEFIRNNKWLESYSQKKQEFDKEVIDFFGQEAVQEYLDIEVQRKGIGTWILCGEERCVIAFGADGEQAKEVLETLCQSFETSRFQIPEKGKQKEKVHKLQERAREYEKKTNGKFCMNIAQSFDKGGTEIQLFFTTDLLDDGDISKLLTENQNLLKSDVVEDKVDLNPIMFFIMKEMKQNGYLGLREDVNVKFGEGNSLILRGERRSVSAEKAYIEGLKLVKRSMILPQSLTMLQKPEEVCLEHRCLLQRTPSAQESQVWFMNNCVVIVYHGEPKEDLSVNLKANVILSDGDIQGKNNYSCFLLLIMH